MEPHVRVIKSCAAYLQTVSATLLGSGVRYALVGVLNTVVGYGVFYLCLRLGVGHLPALAVSYAVGVIHSFFWNRLWTFKAQGAMSRQVPRFLAVTGMTFGLNALMLQGLVHAGLRPDLGQLMCLVVTTVVGFVGHRLWSFR